ncbi:MULTISPECIES: type IV secretion system protein [unclassified Pseudomonas]|uniref:type IV secretion system protein n=1 Tax=unclassified Pseudomonas TaxID=196821 RepID=UPI000C86B2B5|nr:MULTISPECIES: type IV secretion system protein [unclassified Pseudomonas]PMU22988.1 mating pair formation protein [Pseudomonas sp. GP01-A9]PMU28570.1 mating pair formation protein [Pseudomonas sp. GP01-A13]PMU38822.1 mating pair formation protein [Pseudomonas sp. GP01-A8]PMU52440.1 mating pair formation protein [Pseudomonas sp. GP01-A6]PMU54437.1 mating pair formation protein [Pseudomonas sp. GP01-A14]
MDNTLKKDEIARRKRQLEHKKVKQERNRSYFLNGAFALALLGSAIAIAFLAETKTFVNVVTVIGADGEVLKQRTVTAENVDKEQAVIEGVLFDFIRACNTFDPRRKQQLSDTCHTYMTRNVAVEYEKEISPDNARNPYASLGENDWIEAQPKRMNKVGDEYQVIFLSTNHKWGDKEPRVTSYLATIKVAHTMVPRALGDRWENPFGTLATLYRKSEELSRQ